MGHMISAACGCGYTAKDLRIGGGMHDFTTNCFHPALCEIGSHIVTVNLKQDPLSCPDGHNDAPKPYTSSPELIGIPGDDHVSDWQGRKLSNGTYRCPECNQFNMRFSRPHIFFD
jgi:hypothetical protein